MLSPRPMVEFPELPAQLRNSGYHGRRWSRRSADWASISTDKSEQLRNRRQASSALPVILNRSHLTEWRYQELVHSAWSWLPVSAITEMTAVTLFAINLILTFTSKRPSNS